MGVTDCIANECGRRTIEELYFANSLKAKRCGPQSPRTLKTRVTPQHFGALSYDTDYGAYRLSRASGTIVWLPYPVACHSHSSKFSIPEPRLVQRNTQSRPPLKRSKAMYQEGNGVWDRAPEGAEPRWGAGRSPAEILRFFVAASSASPHTARSHTAASHALGEAPPHAAAVWRRCVRGSALSARQAG
eukprot:361442-Prymnesium_polylepis.1